MVKYLERLSMSAAETKLSGEALARKIGGKKRQKALVFGLKGDLGGGKTTFLQGFAKGLEIKQKILSPTFLIMKKYDILPTAGTVGYPVVGKEKIFNSGSHSRPPKGRGIPALPNKLNNLAIGQLGNFYHFDCYRIKKPREILALDFKKIISDPENIIAIEWAERIKKILPKNTIWINFEFIDKNRREIRISKF